MRAAVLHGEAGGGDLRIDQIPDPVPGEGEVRVRVHRNGLCGSDMHFVLDGTSSPTVSPIVLGHEAMGVIDAVGEAVAGHAVGTRVSVAPLLTCGDCARCRGGRSVLCRNCRCIGAALDGALAEFAVVPAGNVLPVPDGVSDELAAMATDSLATAYHAVKTRGQMFDGARVAIWGVGGLGLSAVAIARMMGARSIVAIDPRQDARAWAVETGADEALPPEVAADRLRALDGVDLALEFVGLETTVQAAARSLDHGGRAVIVGIGNGEASAGRVSSLVTRERDIVGSFGHEIDEIEQVLELLDDGSLRLPRAVSDVVEFEDTLEALSRLRDGRTAGSRILVDLQ